MIQVFKMFQIELHVFDIKCVGTLYDTNTENVCGILFNL